MSIILSYLSKMTCAAVVVVLLPELSGLESLVTLIIRATEIIAKARIAIIKAHIQPVFAFVFCMLDLRSAPHSGHCTEPLGINFLHFEHIIFNISVILFLLRCQFYM
nr:MAG TPA: hypothetical protein [Caudoviricetes sp.]